jgi:hypothetical protein
MNIREHVLGSIRGGMAASFAVRESVAGVLFEDEGEFISLDDLGYSRETGYFRRSLFPDAPSETDNATPYTVHPAMTPDGRQAWVLADESGHLTMLGETWQVADLVAALQCFLATGSHDPEPISEFDPAWGAPLTMGEAVAYITHHGWPSRSADATLRRAAAEGRVPGARKDTTGTRWVFSRKGLNAWLARAGQGGYARLGRAAEARR